jgi:hypothetical protein
LAPRSSSLIALFVHLIAMRSFRDAIARRPSAISNLITRKS